MEFPARSARNVDRWLENELERRIYERDYRKGMASGTPPAVVMPVVVHRWASVLMTANDAALLLLALFAIASCENWTTSSDL